MQRRITGQYRSREEAEAAKRKLVMAGIADKAISIREPVEGAGAFDRLAELLVPRTHPDVPGDYQLVAQVPSERADQALLLIGEASGARPAPARSPRERIFEFAETKEELRVEKHPFVREEVLLMKSAQQKVMQINSTLRHTEVEVERIPPPAPEPAAPQAAGDQPPPHQQPLPVPPPPMDVPPQTETEAPPAPHVPPPMDVPPQKEADAAPPQEPLRFGLRTRPE